MPKATTAVIDIQTVLELREAGHKLDLHCIECKQRVRAHKQGTTEQAAHFEHLDRNPACSLSE